MSAAGRLVAPRAGRWRRRRPARTRSCTRCSAARPSRCRAYFADGEVLAYVQAEVFSPADAKIPYQKGRTDRNGWLAFVPDVPGKWRVKIIDATGHGLDIVEVAAAGAPARRRGRRAVRRASTPPSSCARSLGRRRHRRRLRASSTCRGRRRRTP